MNIFCFLMLTLMVANARKSYVAFPFHITSILLIVFVPPIKIIGTTLLSIILIYWSFIILKPKIFNRKSTTFI